jgi:3-oxoacyl-[acyl-carrier protein] reductase
MAIPGAPPFESRLVLVTQADRPLGARLARRLAEAGADLVLTAGVADEAVNHLRRELESLGRTVLVVTGDLADEEHAHGLVDELLRRAGRPTDAMVVVSAPQVGGDPLDPAALERLFGQTVFSLVGLLRWLLPALHGGAGLTLLVEPPHVEATGDAAVVGAVAGIARSLATSLAARNLRVNVVVATPVEADADHGTTLGLALTLGAPASTASGQVLGAG